MKIRWILATSLALFALHGGAQQSDSSANDANRVAAMKGGRISPRQRAELERAGLLIESNLKAGADFLTANKNKPGVVSLASGVQYKVILSGIGIRPKDPGAVLCRYQGRLIDGSIFDKSDDKTPMSLKLGELVAGLQEAVRLMPVGAKWEVVVPPQLGYGARGRAGVGPDAVLIYVVEVVGFK